MNSVRMLLLGLVCVAVAGILSCADSKAVRLRYRAEKLIFEADKLVTDAQVSPEQLNAGAHARFRKSYADLLIFCYAALDSIDRTKDSSEHAQLCIIADHAAVRVAQLFFTGRHFDSSAAVLTRLLTRVPLAKYEAGPAYVLLAQSLQGAGKLDSAVAEYHHAIAVLDPPADRDGQTVMGVFNVPHLIYRIYSQIADSTRARGAFNRAVAYYRNLADRYPKTDLSVSSESVLARLYNDVKDWPAAISSLSKLVDSAGHTNPTAMIQIADIRAAQLRQHDSALAIYTSLLTGLTGRDTLYRPILLVKQGMLLMEMTQYERARQSFAALQKEFPTYYATNALPQMALAQSFEREGNWDRAETEYNFLLTNYPETEEAFSTYLHLVDEFKAHGRQADADRVLQKAGEAFDQAAARGVGTRKEAMALSFKADLYRRQSDWPRTAATLSHLFDKFPETDVGQAAIQTAANIYMTKLKDTTAADSLFKVYTRTVMNISQP